MADKKTKTAQPREPKPLSPAQTAAMASITEALDIAIERFDEAKVVPTSHLWKLKSTFGKDVAAVLRERRPDPKVRKRERLEAKLAKVQAELEALS